MSDVQAENPPVTQPAPGLDNAGHTESPVENPPVTQPDPALSATAPVTSAEVTPANGGPAVDAADANAPKIPDSSYIASELDAIKFGIVSGVSNGVERVMSLIRYVEQHI